MRQSLLHGGLSSVAWNINRQNPDLKLYEFGNCYFYSRKEGIIPKAADYTEKKSLDLFISGKNGRQGWNHKSETSDFYTVKSAVEMVISRLGLEPSTLTTGISNRKYYSDAITYSAKEKLIAEAGKISKSYLKKFDIDQDVFYGHIEWDTLIALIKNNKVEYSELPKYPWVRRDLALLVDTSVKFSQIRDLAFRTEKNILKEVDLFDVYESDSLGAGKKSYAVSFILRDDRNTLTDKSIDKVMNSLLSVFGKELDAKIR
jgi:phenylalanyl-tRNA synthetase beta chain